MSILRYINKLTGVIVEEDVTGCSCKSEYKKLSNYIDLNTLTVDELNDIINKTKTTTVTKLIEISSDIIKELSLN